MADPTVVYAIAGLGRDGAEEIVRTRPEEDPIRRLIENRLEAEAYGERVEDWKPFSGKTIADLLERDGTTFQSMTHIVSPTDRPFDNAAYLDAKIDVIFVDMAALVANAYEQVIQALDIPLAKGKGTTVCFLGFPSGDGETLRLLDEEYRKRWGALSKQYVEKGAPHRVAVRDDDVLNLAAILAGNASERKNESTSNQVADKHGRGESPFR